VQSLRYLPLTAEPRTKYQYCNLMFMTASYIVEVLEGKWLGDVLKKRIWGPLGMTSTVSSSLYLKVRVRESRFASPDTTRILSNIFFSLNRKANAEIAVLSSSAKKMHNHLDSLLPLAMPGATNPSIQSLPSTSLLFLALEL